MKELETAVQTDNIKDERVEKKEIKFIGSILRKKGLTLYSCDIDGNVEAVVFKSEHYDLKSKTVRKKVEFKENLIYTQALNIGNAKRKFGVK